MRRLSGQKMANTAMATTVHDKLRGLSFWDLLLRLLIELSKRYYSRNFFKLSSEAEALRAQLDIGDVTDEGHEEHPRFWIRKKNWANKGRHGTMNERDFKVGPKKSKHIFRFRKRQ